jgi:hypothetical protein
MAGKHCDRKVIVCAVFIFEMEQGENVEMRSYVRHKAETLANHMMITELST